MTAMQGRNLELQYSVWIGCSNLSSLNTFAEMWITKVAYEVTGPGIVDINLQVHDDVPGYRRGTDNELRAVVPNAMQVTISAPTERQYSVCIGRSILSSLNIFAEMWNSKKEYDVTGLGIVHIKCI